MSRKWLGLAVAALALCAPANASFTYNFDSNNSTGPFPDNLAGLHVNRGHGDTFVNGMSWDVDGVQQWNAGLDATMDYSYPGIPGGSNPTPPDLVFAYRPFQATDNFRMRWDDCRLWLGQSVGHPTDAFQFRIDAGYAGGGANYGPALNGVMVGTHGSQHGLYLWNQDYNPPTNNILRTSISFQNQYMLQTDTQANGTADFWLYNYHASSPTFTVGANNSFKLSSSAEGFFGANPVAKPSVTGSWSSGTAAKNVLAALVQLGLVTDNTTP